MKKTFKNKKRQRSVSKSKSRSRSRDSKSDAEEKNKKYQKGIYFDNIYLDNKSKAKENSASKVNLEGLDEDKLLEVLIGINDFDTTKNKSHVGSDLSGVFKGSQVKRMYRQYMNRKGGFNRSLDKSE